MPAQKQYPPQSTRDWLGISGERQPDIVNAEEAAPAVLPTLTLFDLMAGGTPDFKVAQMRVFTRYNERQTGIIVTIHATREITADENNTLAAVIRMAGPDVRASDVYNAWQRGLVRPIHYTAVSIIPAGNVPVQLIPDAIPETDD